MLRKMLFISLVSMGSIGCQSTPSPSPVDTAPATAKIDDPTVMQPVEPMVKEISGSSVVIKPTYYNYEISDQSTSERRALLDILAHLQQLDGLIAVAEANQNQDQRIKFRYDWLRTDMYKITRGISDHLSSPESQPRAVEPISGDYRR